MEIRAVNINESPLNDPNSNQSVDHNKHVSDNESVQTWNKSSDPAEDLPVHSSAVFAVDADDNVVIQLLDENGKVVRQIPPKVYLDMVKKLQIDIKSHYDIV